MRLLFLVKFAQRIFHQIFLFFLINDIIVHLRLKALLNKNYNHLQNDFLILNNENDLKCTLFLFHGSFDLLIFDLLLNFFVLLLYNKLFGFFCVLLSILSQNLLCQFHALFENQIIYFRVLNRH